MKIVCVLFICVAGYVTLVTCELGNACQGASDCNADTECCVSTDRRLKRFVFTSGQGTCQPRRTQGQACHVFLMHEIGNPEIFLNYCPCDEGLVCQGEIHGTHHINPICIPEADAVTTAAP